MKNLKVKLGEMDNGNEVSYDLESLKNMLVVGKIGAGKTEVVKSIVLDLLQNKNTQNLNVVFFDPKRCEFESFKKMTNCEVFDKQPKMNQKIDELNNEDRENDRLCVVIVDELADFTFDKDVFGCLCDIFENGYKAGLLPIYVTYDMKYIPQRIMDCYNSMLVFQQKNKDMLPEEIKDDIEKLEKFECLLYLRSDKSVKLKAIKYNRGTF